MNQRKGSVDAKTGPWTSSNNNKKGETGGKSEDSLRDFWDTIKRTNICITWVSKGEDREKGAESLLNNDS